MIQEQTLVRVADNSGAKTALCIKVLGGSGKKIAQPGDKVVVVVKTVKSTVKSRGKIEKGTISHAVVVRVKPTVKENAVILLNQKNEPVGSRIFGPISARLIRKGWKKVALIAPRLL